MARKPTLSAAVRHARSQVSELQQWGNQYSVNVYDSQVRAWRQGRPMTYHAALRDRREALIDKTMAFMGYDMVAAYQVSQGFGDWGGLCRSYIIRNPL
jgi:hypothetical protein